MRRNCLNCVEWAFLTPIKEKEKKIIWPKRQNKPWGQYRDTIPIRLPSSSLKKCFSWFSPFYSVLAAHTIHVHPDRWKRNNHILSHRHKLNRWFAHRLSVCKAMHGKGFPILELRKVWGNNWFSWFSPYSDISRLWIDHRVTQHPSDIENPSSSNGL